jgi:hypothetical protein
MRVSLAHLRIQSVDVAVFDARPTVDSNQARTRLLADLTARARTSGLKIDKSALAFWSAGRVMFYGTPDLVQYLQASGVPGWTHWIDV